MNTSGQITVRQWFRLPKDERVRRAAVVLAVSNWSTP
jgi:hypothetical protein